MRFTLGRVFFDGFLVVLSCVSKGKKNQVGVGRRGSDDGLAQEVYSIGCLSRCLQAGALHSSHSQGFVPGMENHQLAGGEGGNAICARPRLPEFICGTC